jgi:excisionase family DNA binding protein
MPPLYLTVPEVADRLRLSRSHVYKLARSGALPARRLVPRGKLLFDPAAVEAALRSRAGAGGVNTVPEPAA